MKNFKQYLLEKEGPKFIASLSINLANGKSFKSCIVNSNNIPHDIKALDKDFLNWLNNY
jgi:hypothetical protein